MLELVAAIITVTAVVLFKFTPKKPVLLLFVVAELLWFVWAGVNSHVFLCSQCGFLLLWNAWLYLYWSDKPVAK